MEKNAPRSSRIVKGEKRQVCGHTVRVQLDWQRLRFEQPVQEAFAISMMCVWWGGSHKRAIFKYVIRTCDPVEGLLTVQGIDGPFFRAARRGGYENLSLCVQLTDDVVEKHLVAELPQRDGDARTGGARSVLTNPRLKRVLYRRQRLADYLGIQRHRPC